MPTLTSTHSDNGSLAAAIGEAGRRWSPRALAIVLLVAGVAIVAILLLWHDHRLMAVPLVMPVAFGGWGLAVHGERALASGDPDTAVERILLRALRVMMVVLGAIAATITVFAVTFTLTGSGGLFLR